MARCWRVITTGAPSDAGLADRHARIATRLTWPANTCLQAPIVLPPAHVYVIDKTTGMYAGSLSPAANDLKRIGSISFDLIVAYQRANGDYLLFQEDDGYDKVKCTPSATAPICPRWWRSPARRIDARMRSSPAFPSPPPPSAASGSSITQVGFRSNGILMGTQTTGSGNSYSYTLPSLPLGIIRSPAPRWIRKAPRPPRYRST